MKNGFFSKPSLLRDCLVIVVIFCSAFSTVFAAESKYKYMQLRPEGIMPHGSSEYFSTIPDAKLQIPVHIWGEVKAPGTYYVPLGSSVRRALSAAGGPNGVASMPEIQLIRDSKMSYMDLLANGDDRYVQEMDTYVVERSWLRGDLPAILGIVSTILGIVSVSIAISNRK